MLLDWERHHFPAFRSAGQEYERASVGSSWVPSSTVVTAVDDDHSGADWHFSLANFYEPPITEGGPLGQQVGYVAAGYVGWSNWSGPTNGCFDETPPPPDNGFPIRLGTPSSGMGALRMGVALYDLNGVVVWYRAYYDGLLTGVIQDSEGNIVVSGVSANDQLSSVYTDVGTAPSLVVNPRSNSSLGPFSGSVDQPCPTASTARGTAFVMKLDPDGDIIWNHFYTSATNLVDARTRSWAFDLVEAPKDDVLGYRVIGFAKDYINNMDRPFMLQLDEDGLIVWDKLVNEQPSVSLGGTPHWTTSSAVALYYSGIERGTDPITGDDLFAVSGHAPHGGEGSAFVQLFVESTTSTSYVDPLWTRDLYTEHTDFPEYDPVTMIQYSTDVALLVGEVDVAVVWPVLGDRTTPFSANGVVYKLAGSDGEVEHRVELGEMHAFDLRLGVTAMSNGNIGVCGTKWPEGKSLAGDQFRWDDMPEAARLCLKDIAEQNGWTPDGSVIWQLLSDLQIPENIFNYFGSQSYVAELSGDDLEILWEKQWQHRTDPEEVDDCPGNARMRQCNFRIVQADDGGLVVCGNTGHNLDDAYIARLAPCEEIFAYEELTLDENGEYHITVDTDWEEDMNVVGSIVVDPGVTLTINTATIGFAPSTSTVVTNLVVKPGATLVVKNNAHLTSAPGCEGPGLWDGVKILGTGTVVGAGQAIYESGAKVSRAYVANLCSNDDPSEPTPYTSPGGAGGIVKATDAYFVNNHYDVHMKYHTGYDPLLSGPSFFTNCTFATTDLFFDPEERTVTHVWLYLSHPITFSGCRFTRSGYTIADPSIFAEHGLHVAHTTIDVRSHPETGGRSLFSGLYAGMYHVSIDPSITYSMDEADFVDCDRGIITTATSNLRITNCTFDVPDHESADVAAYGTMLYGTTGFEVEENTYFGHGGSESFPDVGAIFYALGADHNQYYNNSFNGFMGESEGGYSAGTLIAGINSGEDGADGLKIKCNDYSGTTLNAYDVAITATYIEPDVFIGAVQGMNPISPTDYTAPAGNTFALSCGSNVEQHIYVHPDATLNPIDYWHHSPTSGVQVKPECNDADVTLYSTSPFYSKSLACPLQLGLDTEIQESLTTAETAESEYQGLTQVYSDWKDGGDTRGLEEFVKDSANTSYAVRNELMNVAPKVSAEVWKAVFAREPRMDHWHLAQALLANSPLEGAVMKMLDTSAVEPFYKELVEDGQGGGISMHSLYKGELARFYGQKADALSSAVAQVLLGRERTSAAAVLAALEEYPTASKARNQLAIRLALGQDSVASELIHAQRVSEPNNGYWRIQELYNDLRVEGNGLHELSAANRAVIEAIAADQKDPGASDARSWLALLDGITEIPFVLPTAEKRLKPGKRDERRTKEHSFLSAYPNPSNGPVYLVYDVPEGVSESVVRVFDAQGRVVLDKRVSVKGGIIELDTRQHASGLLVATLYWDGIQVATTKLQVVR